MGFSRTGLFLRRSLFDKISSVVGHIGCRFFDGLNDVFNHIRNLIIGIAGGVSNGVSGIGGGVAGLRVAAHYACRTRNNRPGGKISEHGKGRAIDISGVMLRDGSEISVLRDWGGGAKGRALRQMHRTACGPFGTVLGPGSDGYHRDHLHFDTARHRSGSYCR